MSFPNCPICEEIPIATEAAIITAAARISQHWSCDACDHHFETRP
jgi:transposase-like protein